jgi:hypothetical protein
MEAFASIVLLVIAMFVYAGFTAVTEKLDEIIERLTPSRNVHDGELSVGQRAALAVRPGTGAPTQLAGNGPSRAIGRALPPTSTPAARSTRRPAPRRPHRQMSLTSTRLPA